MDKKTDENLIKIRRSSGETQYVTSSELKAINQRRKERTQELKSLLKQRNVMAVTTVVFFIATVLLLFKPPVIIEVPVSQVTPVENKPQAITRVVDNASTEQTASESSSAENPSIEAPSIENPVDEHEPASITSLDLEPEPVQIDEATAEVTVNTQPSLEAEEVSSASAIIATTSPVLVLEAWAEAWSAQDVLGYLSYYAEDFAPANGMPREQWAQQRHQRLNKPEWIKVQVSDVELLDITGDLVQVTFTQNYSSNTFSDTGNKKVVMQRDGLYWRIVEEESL